MKSKHQKREEAMQRAREVLPAHRDVWMQSQPGGTLYESAKKISLEQAQAVQNQASVKFKEAAARAGTDLHGNPL